MINSEFGRLAISTRNLQATQPISLLPTRDIVDYKTVDPIVLELHSLISVEVFWFGMTREVDFSKFTEAVDSEGSFPALRSG